MACGRVWLCLGRNCLLLVAGAFEKPVDVPEAHAESFQKMEKDCHVFFLVRYDYVRKCNDNCYININIEIVITFTYLPETK